MFSLKLFVQGEVSFSEGERIGVVYFEQFRTGKYVLVGQTYNDNLSVKENVTIWPGKVALRKFKQFERIKHATSLSSRYYAEASNQWRGPYPRLSPWATQPRRNVAAVASRWQHCIRFDRPGLQTLNLPH